MGLKKWIIDKAVNWAESSAMDALPSNQFVKDALHSANATLKDSVSLEGAKAKGLQYGRELMALGQKYVDAFGDESTPGKIDDKELLLLNNACDAFVDKALSLARVKSFVSFLFTLVRKLVDKVF